MALRTWGRDNVRTAILSLTSNLMAEYANYASFTERAMLWLCYIVGPKSAFIIADFGRPVKEIGLFVFPFHLDFLDKVSPCK